VCESCVRMVPHIILRSISTVFQRGFSWQPSGAPTVSPRCTTGPSVMALWTSSVGCLESIRGVARPAVDDFTNGSGLYCQKRGNVESRTSKSSPTVGGSLRGMYIWLGQDESTTAPGPARTCQGASAKCYYSVSPRDNEAESWLPGTKRSKRSKGRSTSAIPVFVIPKQSRCGAALRPDSKANSVANSPTIQPSSFNMYYLSAKDLSHLCKCLRPMTDPVFFIR